jgi:hypothetical protein
LEKVMVLGLEANQWVAILLGIACFAALLIIVVAPWRKVRAEHPLPDEVESRLLLGDDPAKIAEEEERERARRAAEARADVLDLDPERRSSA